MQACHDLQRRLLSHTVGLLDLIPSARTKGEPYWYEDDYEPIMFTQIQVHHRTVHDFLLHSLVAKAFLARAGILEQHVRLSAARGSVAFLVHVSGRAGKPLKNLEFFFSVQRPLELVMDQLSIIERLVGAAQGKFLRSLHQHSFMPLHRITADTYIRSGFDPVWRPYVIDEGRGGIYLVGLAASLGAERYVCEVLDLPWVEPAAFPFTDWAEGSAQHTSVFKWIPSMGHQLSPFGYREQLNECLQWEMTEQMQVKPGALAERALAERASVETYLLACYNPYHRLDHSLVSILLQAGANPMAKLAGSSCFWEQWVRSLYFQVIHTKLDQAGLDDIWKTTKCLIAQGANVNLRVDLSSNRDTAVIRGMSLSMHMLDFMIDCSAIVLLEEAFHAIPEFQDFATAMKPKVKRLLGQIGYIYPELGAHRAYPSSEESEMLRLLYEQLVKTKHPENWEELQSALRQVWEAHKSAGKLRDRNESDLPERMTEESDEESGEETNEESDEEMNEASEK